MVVARVTAEAMAVDVEETTKAVLSFFGFPACYFHSPPERTPNSFYDTNFSTVGIIVATLSSTAF